VEDNGGVGNGGVGNGGEAGEEQGFVSVSLDRSWELPKWDALTLKPQGNAG